MLNVPTRIQLTREPGGNKPPPGAVFISGASRWRNPFEPWEVWPGGRAEAAERFARWVTRQHGLVAQARQYLAGRDLACWCPADEPCHGDTLLMLANDEGGAT